MTTVGEPKFVARDALLPWRRDQLRVYLCGPGARVSK